MTAQQEQSLPASAALAARSLYLHRRVCIIRPELIQVRPSRAAAIVPLIGATIGGLCFAGIILGFNTLPMVVLVLLLMVSLVLLPLAGMGLAYSLFGANVIFDRRKGSVTWQQGVIGLGIGTQELVPFDKIAEIVVEEVGAGEGRRPVEEFAQWDIILVKASGKRLTIGSVSGPRAWEREGLARAREAAAAMAALVDRPLRAPEPQPPSQGQRRRYYRRQRGTARRVE